MGPKRLVEPSALESLRALLAYRSRLAEENLRLVQDEAFVIGTIDQADFRKREWRRTLKAAKLPSGKGCHNPKDLRDSFASYLMTAGVQLGYVSRILGHANVAVTAQHYARFVGDTYTRPVLVEPGEVPTDLIEKLANRLATELPTDFKDISENGWKALEMMERETGFEPATLSLGM